MNKTFYFLQDTSNLLNINLKWSLGFYCQHRVKWNLNCSKLFKCGVTQCASTGAALLVNTIFILIEVQDAELEAWVITGLTKYKNSKNYRSNANQKPLFLQSVQLLHTNTLTY